MIMLFFPLRRPPHMQQVMSMSPDPGVRMDIASVEEGQMVILTAFH